MKSFGSLTAVAAMLVVAAGSAWGLSPEDKCEMDKNKIAGSYAFCCQKAEARAIKKGESPDYAKCNKKLLARWARAEQKAIDQGTACIDSVTDTAIQSFVTAHADAVAVVLDGGPLAVGTTAAECPATGQTTAYGTGSDGDVRAGARLSYTDNGDGTITDNNTGLMWEKKDDSGGIHDKDNNYTWGFHFSPFAMNGTMVTKFLATLNGGGGFAGHTDWRIPNVKELQSIVDYGGRNPAVDWAFHHSATCTGCMVVTRASCSCTRDSIYWSSTTNSFALDYVWNVDFGSGQVQHYYKPSSKHVRAVRGGL